MVIPILLFTYNRPEHTRRCLESLLQNNLDETEVIIYCDGAKHDASPIDKQKIDETVSVVKEYLPLLNATAEISEKNKGLANSIINGVTNTFLKHEQVIVLEDDLILSPHCISYMRSGLNLYESNEQVFQISGFSFTQLDNTNNAYFIPCVSTWGWATWKRVWQKVDFNITNIDFLKNDLKQKHWFDIYSSQRYFKMYQSQLKSDKVQSWGIRFYLNCFMQKGLVLYPPKTLVTNEGFDGSGVNCNTHKLFKNAVINENKSLDITYPNTVTINESAFYQVQKSIIAQFTIFRTIRYYLKNLFLSPFWLFKNMLKN